MLRIDLAELVRVTGKNIVVDINETPKSDDDVTYLAPAVGTVTITNTGSLVLVRGRIKTVIEMECGRCLLDVRQPIHAEIEEQYSLTEVESAHHNDAEAAIVADEENEVPPGLMDGTVMDLNVIIRQAVILASPLGPVCRDDCRGLCATCGRNLNDTTATCDCVQPQRYTPLATLKTLLQDEDEVASEANSTISSNGSGNH